MPPRPRPVVAWAGRALRLVAYALCFGLVGLIWSLPPLRRRRRHRARGCATCARHHRVATGLLAGLTVLLLVGGVARAEMATTTSIRCHSHTDSDGEARSEPPVALPRSAPWLTARSVLVAPAGGLATLGGRSLGLRSCTGPALLVMFRDPPKGSGGGTVVGDVFVAWIPSAEPVEADYGLPRAHGTVRYGPNIGDGRIEEAALVRHEGRHIDQWAIATLLAGPLTFPAMYFVDDAFFPENRNHFERAAGLSSGGYTPPPDTWPTPRWPETALLLLAVALLLRRRARWTSRLLVGGRDEAGAHAPQRCPLHTKGWGRARVDP